MVGVDSAAASQRDLQRIIMRGLYETGLFRTWLNSRPEGWELVSGLWSPLYIQIRHLGSHPDLLNLVACGLADLIQSTAPQTGRIIGIASAGVPMATAVSLKLRIPMAYTRKMHGVRTIEDLERRPVDYAEHALVEGDMADNDRIVLVDDVAAMLTSKDVAIGQVGIEAARRGLKNVRVDFIAVVVDRQQTVYDPERFQGARLLPLVRLKSEGMGLLEGIVSARELEVVSQYLDDPHAFQDPQIRAQLEEEARSAQVELKLAR